MVTILHSREEFVQLVVLSHAEGVGIRALARRFGCGRNTIRNILRTHQARRDEGHDGLAPQQRKGLPRKSKLDAFAPHVDAFLTDTHDPETGADGATGRTHDWSISRRLAERSPRPLVLAGGLVPENVHRAVLAVRPAAVDAHTGVEGPDGRKTEELVRGFVDEARRGFAEIS